jgi:hypothetical protein
MRPRVYSVFWLEWVSGACVLSPAWEGRDLPLCHTAEHPADAMPMQAWLRLTEAERAAVVETYSVGRRPLITYITSKERQAALAAD